MKLKVLLAEDHELTKQGIAYGLNKYEDIQIVSQVSNGQDAIEACKEHNPDIILMDIIMPILNGIKATQEIKQFNNDVKVIMLTSNKDRDKVLSSFNSGADAYCMKNVQFDELHRVIHTVLNGGIWIDPSIAAFIVEFLQSETGEGKPNQDKAGAFNLTSREKEIIKLIAEGATNKEISEKLIISRYTVKNHVSNIIQKLAVDDRTQVAIVAIKENLI